MNSSKLLVAVGWAYIFVDDRHGKLTDAIAGQRREFARYRSVELKYLLSGRSRYASAIQGIGPKVGCMIMTGTSME